MHTQYLAALLNLQCLRFPSTDTASMSGLHAGQSKWSSWHNLSTSNRTASHCKKLFRKLSAVMFPLCFKEELSKREQKRTVKRIKLNNILTEVKCSKWMHFGMFVQTLFPLLRIHIEGNKQCVNFTHTLYTGVFGGPGH